VADDARHMCGPQASYARQKGADVNDLRHGSCWAVRRGSMERIARVYGNGIFYPPDVRWVGVANAAGMERRAK